MTNKAFASGGFTLIETLVAVTVLAIGIAGPLTIASRALSSALIAKDQVTATYLAQDALEYVRFARDTNRLLNLNWLTASNVAPNGTGPLNDQTNLWNCITSINAGGCILDTTNQSTGVTYPTACVNGATSCTLTSLSASSIKYLNYDNANHRFTYNAPSASGFPVSKSPFVRKVAITLLSGGTEATLTVTVYWADTAGVIRTVVEKEDLFSWQ